jgi:hypothetical protein
MLRWEENFKIYLKEIGWVDVDSIHLAQVGHNDMLLCTR